jgi:SAM-dependent methyltransferase
MSEPRVDQIPDTWSAGAATYHERFEPFTAAYAQTASTLLQLGSSDRVLDVAAGSGAFTMLAARSGATVTAIDFAPGMVELLERRLAAAGLPGRALEMDGQRLTFDDDSFDAACSMFGLMFFPDATQGVTELCRVTRTGGPILVGTWDLDGFSLSRHVRTAIQSVVPDLPDPTPPVWAPLGTQQGLADLLEHAGVSDVVVHAASHPWQFDDARAFFRGLPDWSPPLKPLMSSLPAELVDAAADSFADAVAAVGPDGMAAPAWLGLGRVG